MDKLDISGSGTFGTDSELEDSLDSLFGQVNQQQNAARESKLKFSERMSKTPVLSERSSGLGSKTHNLRMSRGVNAMTQLTPPNANDLPKKKKKGKRVRKDDGKYSDTKYSTAEFNPKSRTSVSTGTSTNTSSSSKGRASRNAGAWISSSMDIKKDLGSPISTAGKGYSAKKAIFSSKSRSSETNDNASQTGSVGGSSRTRVSKHGARMMNKTASSRIAASSNSGRVNVDPKAKWDSGDQRQRNIRQELLRTELGLSDSSSR